ncbi:unnamed protein product [Allacma fusca]|uniref:Uncharacterized protein n=1 Tax=Allacma fusca TaxID=39272 RepID=A0A8J2K1K9_9HEXA|nr:unnamed protein product [Allacma fusca]
MCLNFLRKSSCRDGTPSNSQQILPPKRGFPFANRKDKSTKVQVHQVDSSRIPLTPADYIPAKKFDEQADLLTFKHKLERNSAERLEFFRNSMDQWKLNNVVLSDNQIKETHEKYKKDSCIAFRSVFYDYFNSNDFKKVEMLRETYINLEGKISDTLNEYLETTSVDIGIYVDKKSVIIATSKNFREPEIIQEITSEIAFLPKMITIGKPAEYQQGNHFNLYDLIKSSPTAGQFVYLRVPDDSNPNKIEKFPINSEEIIAIYFEKLLFEVKSVKGVDEIGNVVITTPFILTSFEKSRLQRSMKMAGCANIRIISSLLATSVVYVGDICYHMKTSKRNEVVLIAQYSETSFSMALVEVSPHGVITKTCTGLENMTEGEDKSFHHAHQLLYNNESVTTEQEIYVTSTYKKAVQYLSSQVQLEKLDGVILIDEMRYGTGITDIFQTLFKKTLRIRLVPEGPIAGACFLASRAKTSSLILPSHVNVLDASRANFAISCVSREWEVNFRNRAFQPGVAFTLPILVPGPGCSINLAESYLKSRVLSTVGQYQITPKNQSAAEDRGVMLRFWMTQDGVVTVDGELITNVSGGYVSVEGILGNDANISAIQQLLLYYKSIEGDSPKEFQPSYPDSQLETDLTVQTDFDFFVRTPSPTLDIIEEEDDSYTQETIVSSSSSSVNESPPEFPSTQETPDPTPTTIDPATAQTIKGTITKAVEESIKTHNTTMYQLTDKKEPFTEKQLKGHHERNLTSVKNAFNQSFSPILQASTEVDDAIKEGVENINKTLTSRLPSYFERHQNTIQEITRKLKKFTLEGICFYENSMEEFQTQKQNPMQEIATEHARLVKEVKTKFREQVRHENMAWREEFSRELDETLEEKLRDLVKDLKENS